MMELPQALRFGTQGRKPTHDFLSMYSHSTVQQDPRPPSQGNHLKTHDFLQPLEERVERKSRAKDEGVADEMSSAFQKTPPPAPPPSLEHNILSGGIGTYSISHISSFKRNQRVLKPDAAAAGSIFTVAQASSTDRNDENSNCSSYSGSDFSLWGEPAAVQRVKTGKENHVGDKPFMAESAAKLGPWTLSEQTSSFSNNHHNSTRSSQSSGQKNHSLLEMLKSARDCNSQDAKPDNSEAFVLRKESSNTERGELRVKVDGKSTDQKPNTPRSKHSATEQRRRSKINDRFQMLRALIPLSEQKRDKASFLLEVIEYVHFLQEKVHKYESSFQGWNHEPEKTMPWRNDQRPAESYVDQSRGTNSGSGPSPTLLFASKIDDKNISISPTIPGSIHNLESGMSTKAKTVPRSSQQNFLAPAQSGRPGGVVSQLTHRLATDAEKSMHQASRQCQVCSCATEMAAIDDKPKERDLSIEGGTISISSVYSKGLLHTLTEALQSSGVDLSHASISVQIDLSRQTSIRPSPTLDADKDDVFPSRNKGMDRSRAEESAQAVKKLKTCRS